MSMLDQLASGSVLESVEADIVTESDMAALLTVALEDTCTDEELDELTEAATTGTIKFTPVEERTIVKLDKKAKKERAYRLALYQVAKEANNPDYNRLVSLWKAEKILIGKIEKKYRAKAISRMKQMASTAKKSSSDKVKKAGAKVDALTKSQKMTQKALSGTMKMDPKTKSQTQQILGKLKIK